MRERSLEALSESSALDSIVAEVIGAHADAVEKFRAGDQKVLNFLMGQVMRRTQGKADPGSVRRMLAEKLGG